MSKQYIFKARVLNVVDGDTFDAEVDVGFMMRTTQRFRVAGIDCPESYRPATPAEGEHGLRAKRFATELLLGREVWIETLREPSVFNRYSAHVELPDGRDFTAVMIAAGMEKRRAADYE